MSVSKIFKRFASKNTSKPGRDAVPSSNVSAKHEKDASSKTLVGTVVPTSPDDLKEVWAAANKQLPQAQGVEKFLNRIGVSITDGPKRTLALK